MGTQVSQVQVPADKTCSTRNPLRALGITDMTQGYPYPYPLIPVPKQVQVWPLSKYNLCHFISLKRVVEGSTVVDVYFIYSVSLNIHIILGLHTSQPADHPDLDPQVLESSNA